MPATFDDVREALVAAVLHFEANNSAVMPPLQFFDSYDLNLHPNGVPIIFGSSRVTVGDSVAKLAASVVVDRNGVQDW